MSGRHVELGRRTPGSGRDICIGFADTRNLTPDTARFAPRHLPPTSPFLVS